MKIFKPISINITPPSISDFDLSLYPKYLPIPTPMNDIIKVQSPMNRIA